MTGAGKGIGKAIALAFLKGGSKIIVNDVISRLAQETALEIISHGGQALAIQVDISNT